MILPLILAAATSVALVDNAQVRFHTVVAQDAPAPVRHGAAELAKYLDGGAPAPGEKTLPIVIRVEELPELVKDGFVLDVKPDGITITGWNARGALYGCYEILKKYAGMRWLVPGANGEYRVGDWKNVSVPVGRQVRNPFLAQRTMSACSHLSAEWQARNNMAASAWGIGLSRKYEDWMDANAVEGTCCGGHCMALLICGDYPKGMSHEAWGEKLCREHPEWHGLIDGKRRPCWHDGKSPNPCVSNPATLDHMAENLLKWLRNSPHSCEAPIIIGNNDTTAWCQCDKCRALDPPETKGTRGELSDRYWYMVNGIAERVWKELPRANLGGWCYQNFWYAPIRVRPNPRLSVIVSFNNQCWRHSVCDPNCAVNREMVNIYAGWKKLGMPFVFNRDEIAANGSPGSEFEPCETVVAKNFTEYRQLGCNGSSFCLSHDDQEIFPWTLGGKFQGRNYFWQAMWQAQYVAALMMWDPTVDWKAALEEANELYYGKDVWKHAMREFRALLTKCFLETRGCIGWGQGANVGPCLDRPGTEKKLTNLINRAVEFAWRTGDGRLIRHVETEREIFQKTWLAVRKDYVLNHREMTAPAATDPICVDGVLSEKTWANAVAYTNFSTARWSENRENVQGTAVKIAYDADNLYFAIEAKEAKADKMKAGRNVPRNTGGWDVIGNHLEVFYSYPDMGESAYHLVINSNGEIIDMIDRSSAVHDNAFDTKAKWAVKTYSDRWILEMAVPFTEIGQKVMPGSVWKVNVGRERRVEGEKSETSTMMAGGQFFGTSCYVNVRFLENRKESGTR